MQKIAPNKMVATAASKAADDTSMVLGTTWDGKPYEDPRAVAYLEARGWKRAVRPPTANAPWPDPNSGGKQVERLVHTIQIDQKTQKKVYQTVAPQPLWYYTLEDAVRLQQTRDKIADHQREQEELHAG